MILLRACMLSVVALAWPALAQTDAHGLQESLKDKQFELRNFSADTVTHYVWEHGGLRGMAADMHSLGVFIVTNVTIKGQKLDISGVRATLLPNTKGHKLGLAGKSAATIEVDLNGADPAVVLPQLRDELFFPNLDSAIAALPTPQARVITDGIMGLKPSDPCHCVRVVRGNELVQVPEHDPRVKQPLVLDTEEPKYTDWARQAKVSGSVTLMLVVDTQGKPTDLWLIKSLGYGLDQAAEEAVRKSKFAPALFDGKPTAVELMMDLDFKIL